MEDIQKILAQIQPFLALFVAITVAFMTAAWISAVIWAFRDIRARSRDIFAQVLATLLVLVFFPLFPIPGLILYMILRPRDTLAETYERTLEEEALLQGIEERLACPGCNRSIQEEYLYCPTCHTRLKKPCLECGRQLHLKWSLCPYCGATQTQPATVLPAVEVEEMPRLEEAGRAALPEPVVEMPAADEPEAEDGGLPLEEPTA